MKKIVLLVALVMGLGVASSCAQAVSGGIKTKIHAALFHKTIINGGFFDYIEKPVMMEVQDSAFGSLALVFFITTIVLIYLITVTLYRSLLTPIYRIKPEHF